MLLTESYTTAVPADLLARYEFREVRNAATILGHSNPEHWADVIEVLRAFVLEARDLVLDGGSEGTVAKKLNGAFRERGWREARVDTRLEHILVVFPYSKAKPKEKVERRHSDPAEFEGYKADWVKGRVAGDVEWNAKDGNLDRNLASYRSLYESGFIDGAVLITRTHDDLKELEVELSKELLALDTPTAAVTLGTDEKRVDKVKERLLKEGVAARLGTTTTTNLPKLVHRMKRGDSGGCPVLAVAISNATWDGLRVKP